MSRKTRSKDSLYGGKSLEKFPESYLPSNREIVQYYYLLKQRNTKIEVTDAVDDIVSHLLELWKKVNPRIKVIKPDDIKRRVNSLITKVNKENAKKNRKPETAYLNKIIDNLCDISLCSCVLPILKCEDFLVQCQNPTDKCVHRNCLCESKIPVKDRNYLYDQRNKIGTKGTYQIQGRDTKDKPVKEPKSALNMPKVANKKRKIDQTEIEVKEPQTGPRSTQHDEGEDSPVAGPSGIQQQQILDLQGAGEVVLGSASPPTTDDSDLSVNTSSSKVSYFLIKKIMI